MGERQKQALSRYGDSDIGMKRADFERYYMPWLLDRIYPVPWRAETEDETVLLYHLDIDGMEPHEIADHRARLRLRLMLDSDPDSWLVERLQRLDASK